MKRSNRMLKKSASVMGRLRLRPMWFEVRRLRNEA
jgi:hypothetical protein